MQPDDPSITPVSTAAAAIAFSIFLMFMDQAFPTGSDYLPEIAARLSDVIAVTRRVCNIAQTAGKTFVDDRTTRQCRPSPRVNSSPILGTHSKRTQRPAEAGGRQVND
jgi:hypothetical protein